MKGTAIKIASIDTMLSFYLAFIYADRPYYDKDRILCMAQYLFQVQSKNRLKQKGLLKRFSIKCYGNQDTLTSVREEKAEMYKKLKNKRGTKEYEEWFLKYNPTESKTSKKKGRKTRRRKKSKRKTRKNSKSEFAF